MNLSQECEGVFLLQRSHRNYQPIAITINHGWTLFQKNIKYFLIFWIICLNM